MAANKKRKYEWVGEEVVSMLDGIKNEDVALETIDAIHSLLYSARRKDKDLAEAASEPKRDILSLAIEGVLDDSDLD